MNRNKCKKCAFYGGKRKRKIVCLTDKCIKEDKMERRKRTVNQRRY